MDLRASLENPSEPLRRLWKRLATRSLPKRDRQAVPAILDQPGAPELDKVVKATTQRQRLLTQQEVATLVEAYEAGASMRELARTFELHRVTVAEHLKREGVAARTVTTMTPELTERAARLYESGLSLRGVAEQIGANVSTVLNAFRRAGVKRRPAELTRDRRGPRWSKPFELYDVGKPSPRMIRQRRLASA